MAEKQLLKPDDQRQRVFEIMLEPQDSYEEDAQAFISFLKANELELSYDGLRAYAQWLDEPHRGRRYSAATYNKRLSGAKNRIRYLFDRSPDSLDVTKRYHLERALKEIKGKKINSHAVEQDRVLSPEEIQVLIRDCVDDPFPGSPKTALMIEFLSLTGLRVSEMLGILLSDIKTVNGKAVVRIDGKGRKERKIKVKKELIKRVHNGFGGITYLFENAGHAYNPKYVTSQIAWAGRLYLDKHISAHTLRHSFATEKLRRTGNLKGVSRYLGHSSTSTTADLYVHDELSWEDVQEL